MDLTNKISKAINSSSIKDWDNYYGSRKSQAFNHSIDLGDFRNLPYRLLFDKLSGLIKEKDSIIEIGAGDSQILIDIARTFPDKKIYGLDYLESACHLLKQKATRANVQLEVICADLFSPPGELLGKFDFVMSFGVVEHFHDLPSVLKAIAKFANEDGIVFTLIPNNKHTIYGILMRYWNIDVYNAHVMYDVDDLKEAHQKSGLHIILCGYFVSSNFSMLSWCFANQKKGINYWFYVQLTRLSKLIWWLESKFGLIKPRRFFAPYIICVSKPTV